MKITPLQPVSFKNATDEEFASAGLIAFQLVFETGCFIERMNDEQTTALLKMGLDYYLKPGDGVNDGQDVVVLPPLP
ncbi:hypothetical protein EPN18_06860 [bacterium]|nr:MAG: hypothetical protein EPN18_06860 [bacterium]